MPDLLAASFVMERREGTIIPTGRIPFIYRTEDGEVSHVLLLDPEVYEEMGLGLDDLRAELTVTVEPGDTLNDAGGDAVLGVIENLDG